MRLTQISHLLNKLCITIILQVFSDSQSLITSIKNRISCNTLVAHIATKYSLAADMARDGEIDLSYVPSAEMLADCFTKPLLKPAFFKQCGAMGMIGIGHGNDFRTGIGNGIGNGLQNGDRNCIGTGNGIGNAVRKEIDWARWF